MFKVEAAAIAALGYAVFPCANPLTDTAEVGKKGKRPLTPHGSLDATTDLQQIEKWAAQFPDANIGIRCQNCLVLDVDNKDGKNGSDDVKNISAELGRLTATSIARTGTGGFHLFFAKPTACTVASTGVIWDGKKTGIDIRCGNAYIIAPPSLHENGNFYKWLQPLVPPDQLAPLPQPWIDDFLPSQKIRTPLVVPPVPAGNYAVDCCHKYVDTIEPLQQGNRNNGIFRIAAIIFWDFGLSESEGFPILQYFNARCLPPLTEAEITRAMKRVFELGGEKERGWRQHAVASQQPPSRFAAVGESQVDISALVQGVQMHTLTSRQQFQAGDFAGQVEEEYDEPEEATVNVPPIPQHLLRMPGFVDEIMDFCLKNAAYPIPALAFGGAVALQSFLCGRKVREPGDLRTNLYLLTLANASAGKDFARKVIKAVAATIGMSKAIGNRFTSGPAVEDAMFLAPNLLLVSDEFDTLLMKIKKGDPNAETILSTLLTLYTSADTDYERRFRANLKETEILAQPHLTILGIATPMNYYASLNEQMLCGGYLARTIVLDASKRPIGQDAAPADNILENKRIVDTTKWWHALNPGEGNIASIHPKPLTIEYASNARDIIRDFRRHSEVEYQKAEDKDDAATMSVWGRAAENATRLALVAACSDNHLNLKITPSQTRWAVDFMDHQVKRSLHLVATYAATTDFDARIKKAVLAMRNWQSKNNNAPMPRWKLERTLGLSPNDCEAVLTALERRKIAHFVAEESSSRGRPRAGYVLR